MSRNARDSDLGYFILDTIICNLISLNVLHADVKHHGVSCSPFLYQIFCMLLVFVSGCIFFPRVVTLAVVHCVGPVLCFPALGLSWVFSCERKLRREQMLWGDSVKY